jgi:hypothetical protein
MLLKKVCKQNKKIFMFCFETTIMFFQNIIIVLFLFICLF